MDHNEEKIKGLESEVVNTVSSYAYGRNKVVGHNTTIIDAEDRHGDEELDSLHVDVVVDNKITGIPKNCYSLKADNSHLTVKMAVDIPEEA